MSKKQESRVVFLGIPKKQQDELRKKIFKEVSKRHFKERPHETRK